jgi:hypothetical protein
MSPIYFAEGLEGTDEYVRIFDLFERTVRVGKKK